eukprot:scaffold200527_cov40-Cyclotella_meneghiniana.AAC.2
MALTFGGFDDTDIGGFDAVTTVRGRVTTVRGRGCNFPWMLTNGQLEGYVMSVMVVGVALGLHLVLKVVVERERG